jgi:hypothetical protein
MYIYTLTHYGELTEKTYVLRSLNLIQAGEYDSKDPVQEVEDIEKLNQLNRLLGIDFDEHTDRILIEFHGEETNLKTVAL